MNNKKTTICTHRYEEYLKLKEIFKKIEYENYNIVILSPLFENQMIGAISEKSIMFITNIEQLDLLNEKIQNLIKLDEISKNFEQKISLDFNTGKKKKLKKKVKKIKS
jgi:hypothetical protein